MDITNRILQNFRILFAVKDNFRNDLNNLFSQIKKLDKYNYQKINMKVAEVEMFVLDTKEKRDFVGIVNLLVSEFRKKYNLSTSYHSVINSFLITADIPEYFCNLRSEISPIVVNNPDNKNEKMVVLPLPQEITKTEINKNWDFIREQRDFLFKINSIKIKSKNKIKPRKNLNRDLEIYNLYKKEKPIKDIRGIINKNYPCSLNDNDTYKIIKNLKTETSKILGGE